MAEWGQQIQAISVAPFWVQSRLQGHFIASSMQLLNNSRHGSFETDVDKVLLLNWSC